MMRKIFIFIGIFLVWVTALEFVFAVTQKSGGVSSSGVVSQAFPLMKGEVVRFYPDKNWYEYKNTAFITEFSNTGEADLRPSGDIVIKNWFGNEIDRIKTNQNGEIIKAGQKINYTDYYYNNSLLNVLGFGKYSATLNLSYSPGNPITRTINFWIIPWELIIAFILSLILYLALVMRNQRKVSEAYFSKGILGHSH